MNDFGTRFAHANCFLLSSDLIYLKTLHPYFFCRLFCSFSFISFFLTVTVLLFFFLNLLFIKTKDSLFLLSRMSYIKGLILDPNIFKMLFNQEYKSIVLAFFFL